MRYRLLLLLMTVSLAQAAPLYLSGAQLESGQHHTRHLQLLGSQAPGYNGQVLQAIDALQARFPDGGGYFIGVKAQPPESPIGYPLQLFGHPLLEPARPTSYCSGSSYTVFIEALNLIHPPGQLTGDRLEALRMQEPDGSRREDRVKAWGWWNADGFGTQYSMVQYLHCGEVVSPAQARPGDFVNISWKNGKGHSVVFLGYSRDPEGQLQVSFFSSQPGTHGLADQRVLAQAIQEVKFVRLTHPEAIYSFVVGAPIEPQVPGDVLDL